eukprot:TCALIF_13877-PA protein Name:"Protein of unknown function" AED:0.85 eAED:1.00 QI:0/-1/0/1/-1/1/1/0/121
MFHKSQHVQCFKCGEPGHYQKHCPSNPAQQETSQDNFEGNVNLGPDLTHITLDTSQDGATETGECRKSEDLSEHLTFKGNMMNSIDNCNYEETERNLDPNTNNDNAKNNPQYNPELEISGQ